MFTHTTYAIVCRLWRFLLVPTSLASVLLYPHLYPVTCVALTGRILLASQLGALPPLSTGQPAGTKRDRKGQRQPAPNRCCLPREGRDAMRPQGCVHIEAAPTHQLRLSGCGGIGGPMCAQLSSDFGIYATRVNNGSPARKKDEFANADAEKWFAFRRLLEKRQVILPVDGELCGCSTTRRQEFNYSPRNRCEPGRGWARSIHHLWVVNTSLAIVAMR